MCWAEVSWKCNLFTCTPPIHERIHIEKQHKWITKGNLNTYVPPIHENIHIEKQCRQTTKGHIGKCKCYTNVSTPMRLSFTLLIVIKERWILPYILEGSKNFRSLRKVCSFKEIFAPFSSFWTLANVKCARSLRHRSGRNQKAPRAECLVIRASRHTVIWSLMFPKYPITCTWVGNCVPRYNTISLSSAFGIARIVCISM